MPWAIAVFVDEAPERLEAMVWEKVVIRLTGFTMHNADLVPSPRFVFHREV